MKFINKVKVAGILTLLGVTGIASSLQARQNISNTGRKEQQKTTVTGCQPATSAIDLDINNVRARLMTGGDMWWNIGQEVAAYEIPKNSGKSSQFAASCWIGGYDKQRQLKVAAQTYRQDGNDYWPGVLDKNAKITIDQCADWDRFWKVNKSTIIKFVELSKTGGSTESSEFDVIKQWPAKGNSQVKGALGSIIDLDPTNTYANFVDLDGDGVYNPSKGEYPDIRGDQFIWWVFNDAGNVKQQSQTASMGIEVQTSAFAYSSQDFLNNATFYNYRVINRGALTIDSTFISVWDDADLGYYQDDFIGCDTTRGLGILYNGVPNDGAQANYPVNSYGANPPQIGLDFFKGPKKTITVNGVKRDTTLGMTIFTYYNNDFSNIGNPTNGVQIYNYMTGSIRNGDRFINDFAGPGIVSTGFGSTGTPVNAVFTGDPGDKTTWSECTCGNQPGDRRFIFSSGPFQLVPGAVNDITFGTIWANGAGGCPNTSFKAIKSIDDGAQALFDNDFKTIEGPEAPRLIVRELNERLIFYLVNDYGSNNYAENYGRADGVYKDSSRYHQVVPRSKEVSNDTLYKFEGYRVFQLANSNITPAEIFDANTGEVDATKAFEVFQSDIQNGVSQIVNYTKQTSISDTTWKPSIKVKGKDSGIVHSFQITKNQFSKTTNTNLVNYQTYYYVAVAYAHNNFKSFNPLDELNTQSIPYLGSSHGAGGTNISVVAAMPNPSNGDMGTVINSDYGSGIVVTRYEGRGNGGNVNELSAESTNDILKYDSIPVYKFDSAAAPINIKVIDPVKVPAYDWVFQIFDTTVAPGATLSKNARWVLTAMNNNNVVESIYSERDMSMVNEQIIEKYGLSVNAIQVAAPGVEQNNKNGYITSSVNFEDPSNSWLWGLKDQADSNFANWIRSGNKNSYRAALNVLTNPCNFNDGKLDTMMAYSQMMANFSPATSSWAPYMIVAPYESKVAGNGSACGFTFAYHPNVQTTANMATLPDVNIVFDPNRANWTKCAVIEMQEDTSLSEGKARKFYLRRHAGLTADTKNDGTPIYSTDPNDAGTSWFPGYAIDQNTGRRLNIVFGEDSYQATENGRDMIWNPTSSTFSMYDGSILFGGKHAIYILGTKYDSCKAFIATQKQAQAAADPSITMRQAFTSFRWTGVPLLNPNLSLRSYKDGLIPTKTTVKIRVNRPYAPSLGADTTDLINTFPGRATQPYYTFSTKGLAVTPVNDKTDRNALLDRIQAVPNPYYGYSGYESSRYDSRIRIINLPAKATVTIFSLDGTLVRTLTKSNAETPYLEWDIRNAAGLPIASGMYLIHVKAEGIGETVIKWFGSMRPIDATTY